jgi:hypothetical protein
VRGLVPVTAGACAPFAGPRPAALAQAARLADVIIDGIREESEWLRGRNPLLEFERMVANSGDSAAGDSVVSAIAAEFSSRLEAGDLCFKSAREFSDAAVGPRAAEPTGYICCALMRLARERIEAMSRAQLARPAAARVPLAALEREAHVTALVQSADSASLVQRRLAEEFARGNVAAVAMAGATADSARTAAVRSRLTAAVRAALSAALVKSPLVVAAPTLKLYAAVL